MASTQDSTGGTTSSKREAVQPMAEVGGVRSSDDPVPDLWSGELAGERRDATCSAAGSATKNVVTAREGYQRPKPFGSCQSMRAPGLRSRRQELGKPDAGKPPVRFDEGREADGHWPSSLSIRRFPPTLHPYSPTIPR